MNTYDLRQIILMQKKIDLYEQGALALIDLASDLRGLLYALETVDVIWKNSFESSINFLEMVDECMETNTISKWQGDIKVDLQEKVSHIKDCVQSLLENYLKQKDSSIIETAIIASSTWLICPSCNEAWEVHSENAMVICPCCNKVFHNPLKKRDS